LRLEQMSTRWTSGERQHCRLIQIQNILRQKGLIPHLETDKDYAPPKAAREQGLKEMEELLLRSGAQS